jgi:hypothetical protein
MHVIWHHCDAIFTGHCFAEPALPKRLVEPHGGHFSLVFDKRLKNPEVRSAHASLNPRFALVDDSMLAQNFLNPVQERHAATSKGSRSTR